MNPDRYGRAREEPGFGKKRRRRPAGEKFSGQTPLGASDEQEDRVAERMGGKRVVGSGAGRMPSSGGRAIPRQAVGRKGDVVHDLALIECKTTLKESIRVEKGYLVKITREARDVHKTPAVVISFPAMPDGVEQDWALVPLPVAREMIEGSRKRV